MTEPYIAADLTDDELRRYVDSLLSVDRLV